MNVLSIMRNMHTRMLKWHNFNDQCEEGGPKIFLIWPYIHFAICYNARSHKDVTIVL